MEDYHVGNMSKILGRANFLRKKSGLTYVIRLGTKLIFKKLDSYLVCYLIYKPFRSSRGFTFNNKAYKYFYHHYNTTWRNERTIEIPIVLEILRNYKPENVLEVGNVLSHYVPVRHHVLDKYEKSEKNITNEDVVDFEPGRKYDLIVSISTIEHVGYDEKPRDPDKIPVALKKLESLLDAKGKAVITIPLGYNPILDTMINNSSLGFTEIYCLKRIAKGVWQETDFEKVRSPQYGRPYDLLFVGIIEKV